MNQTSPVPGIPESDPESATLCLPVFDRENGRFSRICTSLKEFPVYLLNGGVRDFFKALILQQWQQPVDWTFVDDHFDQFQSADKTLPGDELDIVQKRFVMFMKGHQNSTAQVYELGEVEVVR